MDKLPNRRFFFKTLGMSGLVFSGISGFARTEPESEEAKHWDVIVIGGGPGGVPAAVSAARNGARVLLVEAYPFLGGMATTALVNPYMRYRTNDTILSRGLFEEFCDIMYEEGALLDDRAHFDAEPMKRLLENFVLDSGADLLLHSRAIGVLKEGDNIRAARVFHKGGVEDLSADIFIDCTGDGDIAAWAGAPFEIGREQDNACQPMTTAFRMGNVDRSRVPSWAEAAEIYLEAKERGDVDNPRENVMYFKSVHPDMMHFNTTRIVGKSALDGWSLTDAEIEGRRQVEEMAQFFINDVPGFENAYLIMSGPQIGVRESRRVMGHYVLDADDVLEARHFDDGIACANYNIDIHNPAGTGTVLKSLEEGTYYEIPYRCLVPRDVDNLVVASRCISSTHEAHSSLRVMPIVWTLGQAGGTAAAMCIKNGITPIEVDTDELRNTITAQGGFV